MKFKFWKKEPVVVEKKDSAAIFKRLNEEFYQEFVKFEDAYLEAYDALSIDDLIKPVVALDDNGYEQDWKW